MTAPLDVVTYVHEPHEDLARFREPLERAGFRPVERLRSPDLAADARAPSSSSSAVRWGCTTPTGSPSSGPSWRCSEPGSPPTGPASGSAWVPSCWRPPPAPPCSRCPRNEHRRRSRHPGRSPDNPLLRDLPDSFDAVHWHGDTFEPIPGRLLFRGETYPAQGYRVGRSVGIQFHAELGPEGFRD